MWKSSLLLVGVKQSNSSLNPDHKQGMPLRGDACGLLANVMDSLPLRRRRWILWKLRCVGIATEGGRDGNRTNRH